MIARKVAITLPATLLLLVLTAASLHAASVQLNWTPPTTNADGTALNDLAGYKVYHGSGSRQYTASVDVGNVTSYTLSGLTGGRLYYIAVTASDTSGNESVYSDEIPVTPPDPPPPWCTGRQLHCQPHRR